MTMARFGPFMATVLRFTRFAEVDMAGKIDKIELWKGLLRIIEFASATPTPNARTSPHTLRAAGRQLPG
jgi:hypothetical protein